MLAVSLGHTHVHTHTHRYTRIHIESIDMRPRCLQSQLAHMGIKKHSKREEGEQERGTAANKWKRAEEWARGIKGERDDGESVKMRERTGEIKQENEKIKWPWVSDTVAVHVRSLESVKGEWESSLSVFYTYIAFVQVCLWACLSSFSMSSGYLSLDLVSTPKPELSP